VTESGLSYKQHEQHETEVGGRTDPDEKLAEEPIAILGVALKVVSREEAVGGKGEADVGGFGDIERRQN
jgi:hypothetical protein